MFGVPTEDDQIRELEGKELRLEEVELVDCGESSKLEVMMIFRIEMLDNWKRLCSCCCCSYYCRC